jgi:ABC transporter substrate binding protein
VAIRGGRRVVLARVPWHSDDLRRMAPPGYHLPWCHRGAPPSRAPRQADSQRGRPVLDPVEQAIAATFSGADTATARDALRAYGAAPHERERERVQLAILSLSHGDLGELQQLVAHAKRDYRDVLYWQSLAGGDADPIADRMDAALLTPALTPRRLALLREAVPTLHRVAVLWNPSNAYHQPQIDALQGPAREGGLTLLPLAVRRPDQLGEAFATMQCEAVDGLVLLSTSLHRLNLQKIAALALDNHVASIGELEQFARQDGLLSFGPRSADLGQRLVTHVRQALKDPSLGEPDAAPPALELIVNLQTARRLGLTVPEPLVRQATEVIS